MISSLLHLVGLRPRVYYTLTNFRGGGARPPWPPPLNTPMTRERKNKFMYHEMLFPFSLRRTMINHFILNQAILDFVYCLAVLTYPYISYTSNVPAIINDFICKFWSSRYVLWSLSTT